MLVASCIPTNVDTLEMAFFGIHLASSDNQKAIRASMRARITQGTSFVHFIFLYL